MRCDLCTRVSGIRSRCCRYAHDDHLRELPANRRFQRRLEQEQEERAGAPVEWWQADGGHAAEEVPALERAEEQEEAGFRRRLDCF